MFERPRAMSRLALGGYPLGGGYGALDLRRAQLTVDAALEAGWTFIDTAEAYLDSEEKLGQILKDRRNRVFIATKVFPSEAYSYENLRAALEGSLRRLRTDRIDLYQLHGPENWLQPFGPTPPEKLAESLTLLRESGKALQIGVCNLPLAFLTELATRTEIFSTQNLLSLIDRGDGPDELHLPVEAEILPYVREHGVAFIAYSPLSRGLLADDLDAGRTFGIDDERHFLPRYQPEIYPHYVELSRRLSGWAHDHGRTLTQLAIAWTLNVPGVASTLIGAKSAAQIAAVAGADQWTLGPSELCEVDDIIGTLPLRAREAKMVVWDHFGSDALDRLRRRRAETRVVT